MTVRLSSGRVVSVSKANAGDVLDGDHASGVTELTVTDAGEFFDNGGTLSVSGDVLTYTGIAGDDEATTTILLAAPTANAYDDGTRVNVLPLTPTVTAQVVRDGEGASEPAVVLHQLEPFLPLGIRDPDDQEFARLMSDREGDGWVLYDVRGKTPVIDPTFIDGGGGGGTDGGDDDDGFVLPTLSEFVFDGDPDYWVTFDSSTHGRAFTEDEATAAFENLYFTEDVAISAGTVTVPLVQVPDHVSDPGTTTLYPAWVVPLVGQDSKFTIDSATAYGMHNRDDPLDPWNGDVESFLFFASMLDNPTSRTWSQEDKYEMSVTNYTGTGGDQYDIRTWSAGFGDEPLPASSATETYAAANKRALLIVLPIYISTSIAVYTAGSTYTGVRMEQA